MHDEPNHLRVLTELIALVRNEVTSIRGTFAALHEQSEDSNNLTYLSVQDAWLGHSTD